MFFSDSNWDKCFLKGIEWVVCVVKWSWLRFQYCNIARGKKTLSSYLPMCLITGGLLPTKIIPPSMSSYQVHNESAIIHNAILMISFKLSDLVVGYSDS